MPELVAGAGITLTKNSDLDLLRIATDIISGRLGFGTWAELEAHTTAPEGTVAEVPITDTGTHTDPVVGGTVDNSGIFRWSASPAGWERLYDTDAASAEPFADAAAASATAAEGFADDAAASAASVAPLDPDTATIKAYGKGTTFTSGTSGFIVNADGNYERTGAAADRVIETFLVGAELAAERTAGRDVTFKSDVISGAWNASNPTIKQFDAANGAVGGTSVMTLVDGVMSATVTLHADAVTWRFDGTASQAVVASRPYIVKVGQEVADTETEGWTVLQERWNREVATTAANQFGALSDGATPTGTAATYHRDGRTITVPAGSIADAKLRCEGIITAGQAYTIVVEKISGAEELREVRALPDHGDGSGIGAVSDQRFVLDDIYYIQGVADAAGGRDPAYLTLRVDNRNPTITTLWTAVEASVRVVGLFAGRVSPSKLRDLAGLEKAQAVREREEATVGADLPATFTNAYADIGAALRAGHRRLNIASDLRTSTGYSRGRGVEIVGAVTSVGNARPKIMGSTQIEEADWTATAADANVQYLALAYNPLDVWEYDSADTRMGEAQGDVNDGKVKMSASEAAVRAGAGRYWYGTGSEGTGLYVRPFDDDMTGKTWEIAAQYCDRVFYAAGGEWRFENVDLRHSLSHALFVSSAHSLTAGCEIGRTAGNGNGLQFDKGAVVRDIASKFIDAGNDNIGWNSLATDPVRGHFESTWSHNPQADCMAGHGAIADITMAGHVRLTDAGKQGWVTIVPVNLTADALTCTGARDQDFLHQETGSVESVFAIASLVGGTVKFQNTSNPAVVTGSIQGRWTTLTKTSSAISAFALTGTAS